ncbi:MAG: glycosyltransferase family 2 protein [Syntrophales bacterium]
MKHLVSILIPAFNAEKWISDCIESALAQTWPNKEIIVVDDGSKDDTYKIASNFNSTLVRLVRQSNRGASAARNNALSLSKGDYIQWLDSDDILSADKIAVQLEGAENGQSSRILVSGAWSHFVSSKEESKFVSNSLWEDLHPAEWLYRKMDENLWFPPMAFLVSRKLTTMAGPWNESLSLDDDGEYFCRIICCSTKIRFVPESRCFKRSTFGLSSTHNLNDKKLNSQSYSLFFGMKKLLELENSLRTREVCCKLLNRWSILFYPDRMDIFENMRSMATELGGTLHQPKLRLRYRLLQHILGFRIAKKAQFTLPAIRLLARRLFWIKR